MRSRNEFGWIWKGLEAKGIKIGLMSKDQNLLAELGRHDLLAQLMQKQIIAEAVRDEQTSLEELETCKRSFMKANNLMAPESLAAFLRKRGWSSEDYEWQVSLPAKITKYCNKHYRHKAETYFLSKKTSLDTVIYSLLRTKDPFLAQELYLRISGGESNFGDLSGRYSEGKEKESKGIIGPVPMNQAHPVVAEALRTAKPLELLKPMNVAGWWLIIRLENYTPACFDDLMAERLSKELFFKWVNERVELKMEEQSMKKENGVVK